MSIFDALRHRLRVRLRPRSYLREVDEELEFHLSLDAMQREHAARGALTPAAARDAARRRFGNLIATRARTRYMAGLGIFDAARADLRFALRTFRRAPGFTAAAVLTLALGIGANTAIFSAVHTLLLRPLPFPKPEQLMRVSLTSPASPDEPARDDRVWSYPKYVVYRDAQRSFAGLALYSDWDFTVTGGDAERVLGELAGSGYLPTLGVRPALGRNFAADEDRSPGGPRVVMLGDALWRRRFGGDPKVLGRTIVVDGQPYTIVGVLPPGFAGLSGRAEMWVSLMSLPEQELGQPWSHSFALVARLAPGVSPERARGEARRLGALVYAAYPNPENRAAEPWGATAAPLDATRVDPLLRRAMLVLFGAVALVLLIACANVANLFLVRAAGRRREIAVRLAIGAGRGRLVRQLLTESVLLGALGGAAGVAVAWWGVRFLAAFNAETVTRAQRLSGMGIVTFAPIRLDPTGLAFAAALALVTGLLFGLVPALQATRPSLTEALADGVAASAPERRWRRGFSSRAALAAAEVALAIVLLAGAGLMLRSLEKLLSVRPGFDADHVLALRLATPPGRPGMGRDSPAGLRDRILERIGALPGVTVASLSDCPPLNGGCNGTVIALRDRPPAAPGTEPVVGVHWATPSWFAALHVPLRRGRLFGDGDREGARKVVLVNETAARTFWPTADPLGRPVSVGQGGFWEDTAYVVGVVGDVLYGTVDSLPAPEVYLSYAQSPAARTMLFVRTVGDPLTVAPAVRRILHELAPDTPIHEMRTMESRIADATAPARFNTVLLTLFGGLALALATVGTYGVIAYATAQRTQEIGIRMALGATRGDVMRLVVRQGVVIATAGGAVGIVGALAATRVLRSLLYGVAPSDPTTFVASGALLALAVLAANWIPARRAAWTDPAVALRRG